VAALLTRPDPLHVVEHLLESPAAVLEGNAAGLEVVLSAAGSHAEHEPAARQVLKRRRLLGGECGVLALGQDCDRP
jgi:hypothetical protein